MASGVASLLKAKQQNKEGLVLWSNEQHRVKNRKTIVSLFTFVVAKLIRLKDEGQKIDVWCLEFRKVSRDRHFLNKYIDLSITFLEILWRWDLGFQSLYFKQMCQMACCAEQAWELMGCMTDVLWVRFMVKIVLIPLWLIAVTLNVHVSDTIPSTYTY
jgi:hypothetical protein